MNSDEIIGGNQRSRVFDLNACGVVLTDILPEPDAQGTVAHGYVLWRGNKYAYRQVRWTARQCERANIVANKRGGTWDLDILADRFEQDDLLAWGFEPFELGQQEIPPTLDELGAEYGDHSEESFWPYIRVQVSPETKELFDSLWRDAPGDTDADKMAALLGAVDAAVLGFE